MDQSHCQHLNARFHSLQRLGEHPPVELWYCPNCKTTIAIETARSSNIRRAYG
jgi:uncharacterized protein YlaI